jgi:hypothetical protein
MMWRGGLLVPRARKLAAAVARSIAMVLLACGVCEIGDTCMHTREGCKSPSQFTTKLTLPGRVQHSADHVVGVWQAPSLGVSARVFPPNRYVDTRLVVGCASLLLLRISLLCPSDKLTTHPQASVVMLRTTIPTSPGGQLPLLLPRTPRPVLWCALRALTRGSEAAKQHTQRPHQRYAVLPTRLCGLCSN